MAKKIAPLSARQEIDESLYNEKGKLKSHNIQDKAQVYKNIKGWERTIKDSYPDKLEPETESKLWKRAKQLKDEFTIGMLSTDELHPIKSFAVNGAINTVVDYDKMQQVGSVSRQSAWEFKQGNNIREYKNIMRHLCPDDPRATDIEKFRPHKRIG